MAFQSFCFAQAQTSDQISGVETISVRSVKGPVWILNQKTRTAVKQGMALNSGARLMTESHSEVQLKLRSDAAVLVKGDSLVGISAVNGLDWFIDLERGKMLSLIKNPRKRADHFKVHVGRSTIGVRGTVFFVDSHAQDSFFLCTCDGTIELTSAEVKSTEKITGRHHNNPRFIDGKSKGKSFNFTSASDLGSDHSDSDIANLEALFATQENVKNSAAVH